MKGIFLFRVKALFILVAAFALLQCQNGDDEIGDITSQEQIDNSSLIGTSFQRITISKDEFLQNTKAALQISKHFDSDDPQRDKNPSDRSVESNGLVILDDEILYIGNEEDHTYTFSAQSEESESLLNVTLALQEDGSYEANLLIYDITQEELDTYNSGGFVDLSSKAFYTPLDLDSEIISILTNRSFFETVQPTCSYWQNCNGIDCDIYTDKSDCEAIYGEGGCTELITRNCPEPATDQIGNGSTDTTGGGNGTSDTTNNNDNNTNGNGTAGDETNNNTGGGGNGAGSGSTTTNDNTTNEINRINLYIEPDLSNDQIDFVLNNIAVGTVLDEYLRSEGGNPDNSVWVSDVVNMAMEEGIEDFNANDYPGQDEGLPFEWWLDSDFISNSDFFELPAEELDAPAEDLTPREIVLFAIFRSAAILHLENANTASNTTRSLAENGTFNQTLPKALLNGRGDAFRHAYWNALGTAEFGAGIMKLFADAHEEGETGLPVDMDLNNNEQGRDIAVENGYDFSTQDGTISNSTLQAVINGDLGYIDPTDQLGRPINGVSQIIPTNQ